MIGKCKLCLFRKELMRSHFIPAGIYRRLRNNTEDNPNPWVASKGSKPIQSSRQKWAYLLCSDCEQLFSKHGESWVLKHCKQQDGTFPLASILDSTLPDKEGDGGTKLYSAARISEVDIAALTYFAASMFWRGSIYQWNKDGSIPVRLGPFDEPFREYLLGCNDFPNNCYLIVVLRKGNMSDMITYSPISLRTDLFHSHRFPIPGIAFTLMIGKRVPVEYRECCFVSGTGNPIIVTSALEKFIIQDVIRLFGK